MFLFPHFLHLRRLLVLVICIACTPVFPLHTLNTLKSKESTSLYRWVKDPSLEVNRANEATARLNQAIINPEFMLDHWVDLPTSPLPNSKKPQRLTLREAILLALRYNPNIQNTELDRIIERYQLRLANNEFELQYALGAEGVAQRSQFSGVGSVNNSSFLATPEASLKTKTGGQLSLNIANNVSNYNTYTPVLNFSYTQPLLRGFGKEVNEASLLNAIDTEWLNKLNLRQSISDQITQVILAYRSLILSGNNLETQRLQLEEARKTYTINEKKIEAGQLEPTGNIQQAYQIESLNLAVEQAQNDFKTAALDLLQAIGLDPTMRLAVPNDIRLDKIIVPDIKESLKIAFNHNAQFLAQKMILRADERAFKVAQDQQRWQLDLGANAQSGKATDVDSNVSGFKGIYSGQNVTEAISLTLTIPIKDLNRRNQLISAKVKLEKDRINLIAAQRILETNVVNIISNIQSLAKRYQLALKQVSLALKSYQLEKRKLEAGISSALDVSNTQNQLIQAQMGLISAKIAYLNQLSTLQRLLGTTLDQWQIKLRYGK